MSNAFQISCADGRATIRLCRPDRHNALDIADIVALDAALAELARDRSLRVLALCSEGKSFCAGVNLTDVGSHDWRDNPLEHTADRLDAMPFPTVCILQGGVYGGGTDLALACDFRIGADTIKSFIPPAKLGIQYHPHGLKRAVTRLGLGAAKRLFLTAETFDAAEMLRTGFLDWMVPAADLDSRAEQLLATINGLAPLAVAGMKKTLNEIARGELDERSARDRSAASFNSEDFAEGTRAMAEKRSPRFAGK